MPAAAAKGRVCPLIRVELELLYGWVRAYKRGHTYWQHKGGFFFFCKSHVQNQGTLKPWDTLLNMQKHNMHQHVDTSTAAHAVYCVL